MKLILLMRMVLWSFFGIRKRAGLEADVKASHPAQVIAVAIGMVAVFIGILLVLVRTAIHSFT